MPFIVFSFYRLFRCGEKDLVLCPLHTSTDHQKSAENQTGARVFVDIKRALSQFKPVLLLLSRENEMTIPPCWNNHNWSREHIGVQANQYLDASIRPLLARRTVADDCCRLTVLLALKQIQSKTEDERQHHSAVFFIVRWELPGGLNRNLRYSVTALQHLLFSICYSASVPSICLLEHVGTCKVDIG